MFEDESLVERGAALGEQIRDRLLSLQTRVPRIGDVRGLSCMLAIELVTDRAHKTPDAEMAKHVIAAARSRGLLLLSCGPHKNVVRLLPPPLTVTDDELSRGLDAFDAAVEEAAR